MIDAIESGIVPIQIVEADSDRKSRSTFSETARRHAVRSMRGAGTADAVAAAR
jgi:hypothetical protein